MGRLIEAVIDLVSNTPPDKAKQLAAAIGTLTSPEKAGSLSNWASNQNAQARLAKLLATWTGSPIPPAELSGMLTGASAAYHQAKAEQEIELVWTGPSSKLVATRKTEQALLQVT